MSFGFGKAPQCLLDRLISLQYIEAVFGQPAWDPWHIRRVPGEYVPVLSLALNVMAVSFQGFIAATWQTSARSRSALLCRLFEAKVSKTVNTLRSSPSRGCCSEVSLVRISSMLLATCRSIQHALRLWVGTVSVVVCIFHGLSSYPSRTVSRPIMGLVFFTMGSGAP